MPAPPGYFALTGLQPDGEGHCQFLVAKKYVDALQTAGPTWKFYNLHLLPEILNDPVVIFQGLNREDLNGGYCYSGLPSKKMKSSTITLPPPPGMVALVFVAPDHRGEYHTRLGMASS